MTIWLEKLAWFQSLDIWEDPVFGLRKGGGTLNFKQASTLLVGVVIFALIIVAHVSWITFVVIMAPMFYFTFWPHGLYSPRERLQNHLALMMASRRKVENIAEEKAQALREGPVHMNEYGGVSFRVPSGLGSKIKLPAIRGMPKIRIQRENNKGKKDNNEDHSGGPFSFPNSGSDSGSA